MEKSIVLAKYRQEAENCLQSISASLSKEKKTHIINNKIQELRTAHIKEISQVCSDETEQINGVLLTTYASYVIMLEFRNKVWPYDYMAFSRRVGEIWEPFCKLPFMFPVNALSIYSPPKFNIVKKSLEKEVWEYTNALNLEREQRAELLSYYQKVWNLVDSGNIRLQLDLHFKQNDIYYDIDYKSGFSSNEKGNTNRLLMVASIYHSLPDEHRNLMFVRQQEEENNHYLLTLKNSPFWKVYCADAAYEQIKNFSGFDLKAWMNRNMDWKHDISSEFQEYLESRDLLKYLTW